MTLLTSRKPSSLPQDVFTHLLSIAMLYVSIVSLLVLLFQFINALLPDPLQYITGAEAGAVHGATAALTIAFPVFLITSRLILRSIQSFPEKAHLWVRRWLLSLTLFIASITIIVDLIVLIGNFLQGDLTLRFLLKVLAVLLVASAVFAYELWDMRREDYKESSTPRKAAWASLSVVVISIFTGFLVVGSPMYQRKLRFDERRVSDLQMIQGEIISYWTGKGEIPPSLDALTNSISGFTAPLDPQTRQPYEYRVTGKRTFELCATFSAPTSDTSVGVMYIQTDQNWDHDEGRTCFARDIDPDLYRVKPVQFE